jgi:EAL domain-containing protein (putative c-di-GMP-specific phosphodiesterase class I)
MPVSAKRMFKKGDVLMREGDRGNNAYIIEHGSVEILVQQEGTLMQIGTRGAGSIIGEMAMIDDKPRTATVRALEDCQVLEISRDDFSRRVDAADPVLKMVMHVVMTRYRDLLARTQFIHLPATEAHLAEVVENLHDAHDDALGAIKIHNELEAALERKELVLFYQPIIDMKDMRIAGFEALMRWKHPERGMISPGVFIPVAEESGLIVEMTKLALEASCDAAKELKAAADPAIVAATPLFISVNFSIKDFAMGDVYNRVRTTLGKKGVRPEQIHVEITESLLMEGQEKAKSALDQCRALGVGVSIDDFGSGYSSLNYLHRFPIDTLKIDQSFIRAMASGQSSKDIVKAIIAMADTLGMQVIAEGIETESEAALLRGFGCAQGQGYWFARPMPLADALNFVKTWQPPKIA